MARLRARHACLCALVLALSPLGSVVAWGQSALADSDAGFGSGQQEERSAPLRESGRAQAPADDERRTELPEEELGFGWQLVKLVVVLGLVVAITYLVLNHGLRRVIGARALPGLRGARLLEIVERTPLDPKGTLYVVRAAGEYLLLGRSDAGVSLLSKLDSAEVQRLLAEPGQGAESPFLVKLLQRRQPPK